MMKCDDAYERSLKEGKVCPECGSKKLILNRYTDSLDCLVCNCAFDSDGTVIREDTIKKEEPKFQVGDIVRLKCGGKAMVVVQQTNPVCFECVWHDKNGIPMSYAYSGEVLYKIEDEPPTAEQMAERIRKSLPEDVINPKWETERKGS